jgi:hypothetical protein
MSILLEAAPAFSQARIVFNNDPYVVLGTGTFLVIDNGNANAITEAGTGGRIISEGETRTVRWNITSNTGTYVIPFYDDDNTSEIPFTVTVGTAGSAGGRIDFSTYDAATWDNNTYRPSDVTNVNSAVGGANNSSKIIDRFWITDASSYGTKPSATLSFTYIDAEWSAAGNAIAEANLGAQRFNTTAGNWDAYTPGGTVSIASNTVVSVPATPADFFRSWTLTDNTSPLPVELIQFEGECLGTGVSISWTTASETNNDFFTLQKSENGIDFQTLAIINGNGNSSIMHHYTYTDNFPFSSGTYYRLVQTDYNGHYELFPPVYAKTCSGEGSDINIYSHGSEEFTLLISSASTEDYLLTVYSATGQIIMKKVLSLQAGAYREDIQLDNFNSAMYFVNVTGGGNSITKRVIVSR